MGLGLAAKLTSAKRSAFFRAVPSAREVAERFGELAANTPLIGPLAKLVEVSPSETDVELLPLEEPVRFAQKRDCVIVNGRTSSLGPGYHAHLVTLLDELVRSEALALSETEEELDETGYLSHRDFDLLRREMAAHFGGVADLVLDHVSRGFTNMAIGMPVDGTPVGVEGAALSQRGPYHPDFLANAGSNAASHFAWWDRELSHASALGLAEALLWTARRTASPSGRSSPHGTMLADSDCSNATAAHGMPRAAVHISIRA